MLGEFSSLLVAMYLVSSAGCGCCASGDLAIYVSKTRRHGNLVPAGAPTLHASLLAKQRSPLWQGTLSIGSGMPSNCQPTQGLRRRCTPAAHDKYASNPPSICGYTGSLISLSCLRKCANLCHFGLSGRSTGRNSSPWRQQHL